MENLNKASKYETKNGKLKYSKTPTLPSPKKIYAIYTISILIIAILAISLVYIGTNHNQYQTPVTSTSLTTVPTTILINNTTVSNKSVTFNSAERFFGNFFANYQTYALPTTKVYYNHTYQEACNYVYLDRYYTQPGAITANAKDFSTFNKSKPLIVSFSIFIINQSNMTNFSTQFYNNKGYCKGLFTNIISNTTSNQSTYNIANLTVYNWKLSNFTNDGLNLTGNKYSGVRPDLYLHFSKSLYKNTLVGIMVWGFKGYQNNTYIEGQYNKFLTSFKNYTN